MGQAAEGRIGAAGKVVIGNFARVVCEVAALPVGNNAAVGEEHALAQLVLRGLLRVRGAVYELQVDRATRVDDHKEANRKRSNKKRSTADRALNAALEAVCIELRQVGRVEEYLVGGYFRAQPFAPPEA